MKVLSNQWRASLLVPSFLSRQRNTTHQYIASSDVWDHRVRNRFGSSSNGQMENSRPHPRQLENQIIIPSASGIIPSSVIKNIPILKSYTGGDIVISRSKLYLLNKLFPFVKQDAVRPNTDERQYKLSKPKTFRYCNDAFYFKPYRQSKVLSNGILPPFPKEYNMHRYTSNTNKTGSATDRLKPRAQASALANVGGLYQNQSIIGPLFPNGYLNTGDVPANSVKQSHNHIVMGKASMDRQSYLKPQETPLALSNSFQIIRGSNFRPVMSAGHLANNAGFSQSQLSKGFHIRFPWTGKGLRTTSNAGKVVTEGELKEKGLLSDILSRNHINNNKRGKVSK